MSNIEKNIQMVTENKVEGTNRDYEILKQVLNYRTKYLDQLFDSQIELGKSLTVNYTEEEIQKNDQNIGLENLKKLFVDVRDKIAKTEIEVKKLKELI